jgi:hypothetical protein
LLAYGVVDLAGLAATTAAFLVVATLLGEWVLRLLGRLVGGGAGNAVSAGRWGAALLAGLGGLSTIGVALGLAGLLGRPALTAVGVAVIASSLGPAGEYWRWLRTRRLPESRWLVAGAAAIALLLAFEVAVALAPPAAVDELAYHLPQAELVADSGELPANVGGHWLYGNIPKLVEVLYAEALVFSSVHAVAHLLHLALLVGVLLFAYGTVARFFGAGAAMLAVLLLLLYDELTRNATIGYVDAATAGFELAAVLSAAAWLVDRRPEDLGLAALFAGGAAGSKYSGAATLAFVAVVALVTVARSRTGIALLAKLAAAALLFGGFWYVKNLAEHGNPTYPFLFGHEGVGDETYESAVDTIQGIGSPSAADFARWPVDAYARLSELPAYVALYLFPLALLVRSQRRFTGLLAVYVVVYAVYWFFLGSHNTRFVMSAVAAALILCAIAVVRGPRAVPALFAVALAVAAAHAVLRFDDLRRATWNELAVVTRPDEMRFLLSGLDADEFLRDRFGCHYEALARLRGPTAFLPAEGLEADLGLYSDVELVSISEPADARGFEYLLVRGAQGSEPGEPIWTEDDCRLYDLG